MTNPVLARRNRFLWVFTVVMVATAGTAFAFKLYEFVYVASTRGGDALASFLVPVLTYLVVATGFGCLFVWAILTGQFRDLEGPKYRMLEMQDEFDAAERGVASRALNVTREGSHG